MASQPLDSKILLALSALPDCGARDQVMLQIASLRDRLVALQEAADGVLKAYMPMFPDSRAVDDCLVALALARAQADTAAEPKRG